MLESAAHNHHCLPAVVSSRCLPKHGIPSLGAWHCSKKSCPKGCGEVVKLSHSRTVGPTSCSPAHTLLPKPRQGWLEGPHDPLRDPFRSGQDLSSPTDVLCLQEVMLRSCQGTHLPQQSTEHPMFCLSALPSHRCFLLLSTAALSNSDTGGTRAGARMSRTSECDPGEYPPGHQFPHLGLSPCLTIVLLLLLCKRSCVKAIPGAGEAQGKALGIASVPCSTPVCPSQAACTGHLLVAKRLDISFILIFPRLLNPSECHMRLLSPRVLTFKGIWRNPFPL